jgi:hypothetical protein
LFAIKGRVPSGYFLAGVALTGDRNRYAVTPVQRKYFETHVKLFNTTFVSEIHLQFNRQACTNAKVCENKELVAYCVLSNNLLDCLYKILE